MVEQGLLTRSKIFITTLCLWIVGLILASNYQLQIDTSLLIVTSVILIILFWYIPIIRLICIGTTVIIVSNIYYYRFIDRVSPTLEYDVLTTVGLIVLDRPRKSDAKAFYLGRTAGGWYISFTQDRSVVIEPGTIVSLTGKLESPSRDDEFYRLSQVRARTFGQMRYPTVNSLKEAELTTSDRLLIQSKKYFEDISYDIFTEPYASLFAGIIAGQRSGLSTDILEDFRIAGLSHLIAVSGFNVTLIVGSMTPLLKRFSRHNRLIVSLCAITIFVVFTGTSASVVRAGILASLFIIAQTINRKGQLLRLLVYTAVTMSLQNPLIIRYDIGFQLSFMAVIGLALFATPIQEQLMRWKFPEWLAGSLGATSAAQLTTVPIIAYYFGSFSLYSILANILVEPIIPIITIAGIPLILLTSLIKPFGQLIALPFAYLIKYILYVSHQIAQLPYSDITLPSTSLVFWASYYLFLISAKAKRAPP